MKIRKVSNGYVITSGSTTETIHSTIEDVLAEVLFVFEGKSRHFGGKSFAEVHVLGEGESVTAGNSPEPA